MILSAIFDVNAQEKSNIQLKVEAGPNWDWVEERIYISGSFLSIEPKLKTSENTVIGLRIGAAKNTQRILTLSPIQFLINNDSGKNRVFSFVPTFDYYFKNKNFRPYVGIGAGYYFLTTSKDVLVFDNTSSVNDLLELSVNNQAGILLRGGLNLHKLVIRDFDLSKLTIGLEFNYVPTVDVKIPDGQIVGTVLTSNIALSLGYTFNK